MLSNMNTKEITTTVENQIEKMSEAISQLPTIITSQEEYDATYEIGKKVATLLKNIDTKEKSITKPINDSLKEIRNLFKPFKTQVESVSDELKKRRQLFIQAEEAKKQIEEERIAKRVEKGTMREDTAVTKLATIEETKTDTRGGMTSVLRVKVLDIKLIPAEYLIVDETKIKQAYREGVTVEGVECFYEKVARN